MRGARPGETSGSLGLAAGSGEASWGTTSAVAALFGTTGGRAAGRFASGGTASGTTASVGARGAGVDEVRHLGRRRRVELAGIAAERLQAGHDRVRVVLEGAACAVVGGRGPVELRERGGTAQRVAVALQPSDVARPRAQRQVIAHARFATGGAGRAQQAHGRARAGDPGLGLVDDGVALRARRPPISNRGAEGGLAARLVVPALLRRSTRAGDAGGGSGLRAPRAIVARRDEDGEHRRHRGGERGQRGERLGRAGG